MPPVDGYAQFACSSYKTLLAKLPLIDSIQLTASTSTALKIGVQTSQLEGCLINPVSQIYTASLHQADQKRQADNFDLCCIDEVFKKWNKCFELKCHSRKPPGKPDWISNIQMMECSVFTKLGFGPSVKSVCNSPIQHWCCWLNRFIQSKSQTSLCGGHE